MLRKILTHRLWSALLLLALLAGATFSAVSYARLLRGDIDIASTDAGDLPRRAPSPVRRPPNEIKFAYDCRLQLNDFGEGRERKIIYKGQEHVYDLYAYADLSVKNELNSGNSTDQMHFNWVAAIVNEEAAEGEDNLIEIPLAQAPADAFSTKGHGISLSAYQVEEKGAPQFNLWANVKLPVGNYFISGNGRANGAAGETLSATAVASIPRSSGPNPTNEPDQLWRRLYVECTPAK